MSSSSPTAPSPAAGGPLRAAHTWALFLGFAWTTASMLLLQQFLTRIFTILFKLLERRFDFAFDALDAQGKVLASAALAVDNRAFLAAEASREVELSAAAVVLRVRGTETSKRRGTDTLFVQFELDLRR